MTSRQATAIVSTLTADVDLVLLLVEEDGECWLADPPVPGLGRKISKAERALAEHEGRLQPLRPPVPVSSGEMALILGPDLRSEGLRLPPDLPGLQQRQVGEAQVWVGSVDRLRALRGELWTQLVDELKVALAREEWAAVERYATLQLRLLVFDDEQERREALLHMGLARWKREGRGGLERLWRVRGQKVWSSFAHMNQQVVELWRRVLRATLSIRFANGWTESNTGWGSTEGSAA